MTRTPRVISLWEWIAAGIGAVLVAGAIGSLLLAARRPATPPDLTIRLDGVQRVSAGFLVTFTVSNHGRKTAADVTVEGLTDGTPAERSHVRLDFVPGGSEASGGLLFTKDPGRGVRLRALGYRDP